MTRVYIGGHSARIDGAALTRATARAETLARMEHEGTIVRGCTARSCAARYAATDPTTVPGEGHTASARCESGRRPHCTCDTCY